MCIAFKQKGVHCTLYVHRTIKGEKERKKRQKEGKKEIERERQNTINRKA